MKKAIIYILVFGVIHLGITSNAQVITTIVGNGTSGDTGDGGPATAASLYTWGSMAVDDSGNLYIGNFGYPATGSVAKVRMVNKAGIISTFAGIDSMGYGGDGGPATTAILHSPGYIAFDSKRNVYITDAERVRKVDVSGIITTFAGNGSFTISGDGGQATAAGLGVIAGICVDNAGNVYIAAAWKIRKVDTAGIISTFAGTDTFGYSGDGGAATAAELYNPSQMAWDAIGNMYVADESENRVRKINTEGIITTIAGNGTAGYSGDGEMATDAELNTPTGVFVDRCNNVYIADEYNNVVRVVEGSGIISTFAGTGYGAARNSFGSGGYSGDGGPATVAELNGAGTVCLDSHGNMYIDDNVNLRIRYIPIDSCVNTTEVPASPVVAKGDVKIYPDPADEMLTISNSSDADNYSIHNLLGRQVMQGALIPGTQQINVDGLTPGSYIISFSKDNAPAGNNMFIKK